MSEFPLPRTFEEALKISEQVLSQRAELVQRGVIQTESEQLVIGAYRKATGRSRTFSRNDLYMRVMEEFPKTAGILLVDYAQRRAEGQILQYILGYQYFFNHEYLVTSDVLVPRPETEILVLEVIKEFKRRVSGPTRGLELGLGSGIISIELLKSFSSLNMDATEVSTGAIAVAHQNAAKILGEESVSRLLIHQTREREGFEGLSLSKGTFDFIVSNPPYLVGAQETEQEVGAFEPHLALFAPVEDPLYYYRKLVEQSPTLLMSGGYLFCEIPHEREKEIIKLFQSRYQTEVVLDLNERARVIKAKLTPMH
jgi:release factor glutamine methyltransferase